MDPFSEGLRALLRDELNAFKAHVEQAAERAVQRVLAQQQERYEPLHVVLGISAKASWQRLQRDPALRGVGIMVGKRLQFRRADVLAYLKARGK